MSIYAARPTCVLIQPNDPEGLCFPDDIIYKLSQISVLPNINTFYPKAILAMDHWLNHARFLFGTWRGMPRLDQAFLERMPHLEAVFYAGGSIEHIMTPEAWERDIHISTSIELNSESVASFTLSQILFALKLGWHHIQQTRLDLAWRRMVGVPGIAGSKVGVISVGMIGRRVVQMLDPFGVEMLAYDICPDMELAKRYNLRYVVLEELFASSQVVTIHTPLLPSTQQMIDGTLIGMLPPNGVLINTARGGVMDEPGMIRALQDRPDIIALLDVTDSEPPVNDSLLWTLPNVFLTPHIAGAFGMERRRLGLFAIEEMQRYLSGAPLLGQVPNPLRRTTVS